VIAARAAVHVRIRFESNNRFYGNDEAATAFVFIEKKPLNLSGPL
jgi:hypothetical protein